MSEPASPEPTEPNADRGDEPALPQPFLFDDEPSAEAAIPAVNPSPTSAIAQPPALPVVAVPTPVVAEPAAEAPVVAVEAAPRGGFWFRFGAVYWLLYILPFPFDQLPWTGSAAEAYGNGKQALIAWLVNAVIGVKITVFPNGSGDTTYNWFEVACYAIVALAIGGIWELLRSDTPAGPRTIDVHRTLRRYWLAATMLGYGLHKAVPLQFGQLMPGQLVTTWGQSSPMNVLWTFMACSPAYTMFGGIAEVVAAALLFWRRTALLGAIVAAAVMANVAMLNFCYDVPVKLFSTHLFVVAVLLAAPEAPRLLALFVHNRNAPPARLWPWPDSPLLNLPAGLLQVAFVGWLLFGDFRMSFELWQKMHAPQPPVAAMWEVEHEQRNGVEVPPFTSPVRWRYITFIAAGRASIAAADGTTRYYRFDEKRLEAAELPLEGVPSGGAAPPAPLQMHCKLIDDDHLQIECADGDAALVLRCRRVTPADFPLVRRGFHFVNEFPFNRR